MERSLLARLLKSRLHLWRDQIILIKVRIGQPRVCIVGNLVGQHAGNVTTQGQILANLLVKSGYDVISVSSKLNRLMRMAEIIMTVVGRRRSIDLMIVEVYSGLSFVIADTVSFIGKHLGIATVGVLHGGGLPEFTTRKTKWVSRVLRRFDELVTPSAYLKGAFESLGFESRIIPNVIDLEKYPHRLRRHIEPKLIWMRAFHSIYNPGLAIRAFSLILDKYADATLVMAGVDKGLEASVKQLARDLGVDSRIGFPGFLGPEAKAQEFSKADIYLNTNDVDNMPVTVVESCAFGLPVIATDVGGIGYLINNGIEGLLVPAGDAEGIADAVTRLLRDPELTSRLSANGRLLAERSSWDSVRSFWENMFRELGFAHPIGIPSAAIPGGPSV